MRNLSTVFRLVAGLALLGLVSSASAQNTPTLEEMWRVIQQQQAEIDALKQALDQANTKIEEAEVKVIATADAIEASSVASAGGGLAERTSLGAYGELHYNNLDNQLSGGSDRDQIDLHRFVLFLGHQFSDSVRFFSELEVEHSLAGDGAPGEVEIEQAFIEWDINRSTRAKAGLFLLPVGILNETHEPDTFYGVERNPVENNIIPTTWWEAGAMLSGEILPGFSYDAGLHSGLFLDAGDWRVRSGRQKVAEAKSDNFAFTGRLKYTAVPGLELAATVQYQDDLRQDEAPENMDATLLEVHASYQAGPFGLRALAASWRIDDSIEAVQAGADRQHGFYIEPSYRINEQFGVFARYNEWDNQAGNSADSEFTQIDFGVNYWLTEQVVFKADYQDQDAPSGQNEYDGFNLGVGWSF